MCRSIKPLFNFEPPTTDAEARAAALQFVRKIAGTTKPSKDNQVVFDLAVDAVTDACEKLLAGLVAHAPPQDREAAAAKARQRWQTAQP